MAFYKVTDGKAAQILPDVSPKPEKAVQNLVEDNLETFFGVRFVATEFSTGTKHGGRIDTLGLDQDGSPVIVEYKKATNPNVMNQGLFYLDWLLDHRGDFELAARSRLGDDVEVTWSQPRLILLAQGYNKYDHYAVNRIDGRIELWTYTFYEDGFLRVEPIEGPDAAAASGTTPKPKRVKKVSAATYDLDHHYAKMSEASRELFDLLREQILALGEVTERFTQHYIAYRRQRNFVEVVGQKQGLRLFIDGPVKDKKGIGTNVRNIGRWGSGELSVTIKGEEDLEDAFPLIAQAYALQQ